MGFLFGLLVGAAVFSTNGGTPLPSIAAIPLRCLAALDDGDVAYKDCRRLSLAFEVQQQYSSTSNDLSGVNRSNVTAKIDEALALEIRALRSIEAANKAKQEQR